MFIRRPAVAASDDDQPLRWSSSGEFVAQPQAGDAPKTKSTVSPAPEPTPPPPAAHFETTLEPAPPRRTPRKESVPMPSADEILEAINGSVAALAANAAAVDAEGKFPDENLDILADIGAFGLVAS